MKNRNKVMIEKKHKHTNISEMNDDMVNQNFDEFIKTEAKHKSTYLGSDQQHSHEKAKRGDDINTRSDTNMSVGAVGRDVFDDNKRNG
jgi:hypothetical protein